MKINLQEHDSFGLSAAARKSKKSNKEEIIEIPIEE